MYYYFLFNINFIKEIFTGEQAQKKGLVDELGGLSKAIEIAKEKTGISDFILEVYPKRSFLQYIIKYFLQKN